MRKSIVIILCCCSTLVHAQVWNGDLRFRSQSEIDDFGNQSYTAVNGNVAIWDAEDGEYDIRNLAGLAGLTSVSGTLVITTNHLLQNTVYLNISSVGEIQIQNNAALTTINGLPVTSLALGIIIINNPSLTSITAFAPLTNITPSTNGIAIFNNPLLTNLSGFSNLEVANGISINNNGSLTTLAGFSNLEKCNAFNIVNNASLTNMDGLNNLATCSTLTITNNPSLVDIDGLANLTTVSFLINISDNPALQNVDGLSSLAGSTTMYIIGNNAIQTIHGSATLTSMVVLRVENNAALKTISGFNQVEYMSLEIIHNHQLESLTGFGNVQRAGNFKLEQNWILKTIHIFPQVGYMGQFFFDRNYIADDISPMPLLDTVLSDFNLLGDTMLTNLDFVPGLQFVGNLLRISGIEKLESIDGLSNLDSVGGSILIGLFNTPNIDALSKIEYVNGSLDLGAAYEISNLWGLRNLKKVGHSFTMGGFHKLTHLNDLANLESIGEGLAISRIFNLTNLYGLRNVRNAKHVWVTENPLLANFCGLFGLFTMTPPTGLIEINFNLANPTAQGIRDGGPCSTLPVHLLAFDLACANNRIHLTWITSNETNNSHFIVQRSGNGSNWTDLEIIGAAGNNGAITKYSFTDNQPLEHGYYRLAQVDIDRSVHYLPVARASCAAPVSYKIWPNPATDKVTISIQSNGSSSGLIRVCDGKGRLVKSRTIVLLPGQNQFDMNMTGTPAGIYFVHVLWDGNMKQQRTVLVKK